MPGSTGSGIPTRRPHRLRASLRNLRLRRPARRRPVGTRCRPHQVACRRRAGPRSRTASRCASSTTTRSTVGPSASTQPPTSDSRCSFRRNSVGPARTSSGSWTPAGDRYVNRKTTRSYPTPPSWPGIAGKSSGENRALPDRAFPAVRSRRSPIRPPSRKRTIRRRTPPHILGNGSVTRDSRGDRTRPLHQEWLGAPCPAASESSAGSARNFSPRAPRTLRTVSNVGLRSPERAL